jgi:cation-transporting P-type ATPase F
MFGARRRLCKLATGEFLIGLTTWNGEDMERIVGDRLHHLPAEEVLRLLDTDAEKGLDVLEVRARQERFGLNEIPTETGQSAWLRLLLQFHQPLVYILLAAGAVTFVLNEWIDSGVIFAVVLVNAVIGFLQESKAARAIQALAKTTVTEARVVRGGEVRAVPSVQLVPGDIVLLQSGDKTPADLRLFRCRDLQIDESALTGESAPVHKQTAVLEEDALLAERRNLAFTSTLVTYGQGRGVVFATGADTEIGRISELISTADVLETPLTRKIARFSHLLLGAIVGLAALTFVIGVARSEPVIDIFMSAVALAVAAIPEGLPAVVTITLAIGVNRMARRRAIIRKLPAVETLGSTTTICSDKTGTLTVNQMTVRELWAGGAVYDVSGTGYEPEGEIRRAGEPENHGANEALEQCLLAGLLCNDSSVYLEEEQWKVQGDPTEAALLVSAGKAQYRIEEQQSRLPRIDAVPFESEHQYMATLHEAGDAGGRLYVKGAVEVVLAKCRAMMDAAGTEVPLDAAAIQENFDALATKGLRVLGFAVGQAPAGVTSISHSDVKDLTFVGLQGMIDPPRPEAVAAVAACKTAGIRVKMITGDHAVTARAIAEQIGLGETDGEPPAALASRELSELSDQELIDRVDDVAVFARVTPEQKLRLVRALQARGHVVAMTGDGVNDAPALRQADIGVAMGRGGTEVAKEASDMVLTDDNFATIEAAVEEGRSVFDNLTKFIVWTLPTNMGEGLVILAAIAVGVILPIYPVQILWINMTTAVLLGMMLAFEPKERDIMRRPPRAPGTPILTGKLIFRIVLVGLIMLAGAFGSFRWSLANGYSENAARTVAVNVFVFVEMFYLLNCRSLTKSMFALGLFSNRWIPIGISAMIVLQLLFTYAPFMNWAFHSAPIGWDAWWRILLTGLATYAAVGFEKWLGRMWAARSARSRAPAGR